MTGCSTGFGHALVQAVIKHGDRLAATARHPEQLASLAQDSAERVHVLSLDVTNPQEVQDAVKATIDAFDRIDVVANIAGYGLFGAFEELSAEQVRQQLEVNLFGAMNVTRAVLPYLRSQRSGHVLQMSSLSGQVGSIGFSAYQASKFGLEGWSEALSKEIAPFGIRVTIIEPGTFRTNWAGRSMVKAELMPAYNEIMGRRREQINAENGSQRGDPARAAQAMIAVVESEHPPLRLPLGSDSLTRIRQHMQQQHAELEQWEQVSRSTDFQS